MGGDNYILGAATYTYTSDEFARGDATKAYIINGLKKQAKGATALSVHIYNSSLLCAAKRASIHFLYRAAARTKLFPRLPRVFAVVVASSALIYCLTAKCIYARVSSLLSSISPLVCFFFIPRVGEKKKNDDNKAKKKKKGESCHKYSCGRAPANNYVPPPRTMSIVTTEPTAAAPRRFIVAAVGEQKKKNH